jgi:hypothetical protein
MSSPNPVPNKSQRLFYAVIFIIGVIVGASVAATQSPPECSHGTATTYQPQRYNGAGF